LVVLVIVETVPLVVVVLLAVPVTEDIVSSIVPVADGMILDSACAFVKLVIDMMMLSIAMPTRRCLPYFTLITTFHLIDILSEYVQILLGFFYELETCAENFVFYSVMIFA